MSLFHWVSPQRGKNPGRTHRPRAGSCRLAGVALAGRGRCCPGRPGPAAADPETGETQQPRGAARPTNQRSPGTQPGERPGGPIRDLAARCVTGCTPHAVANQRAPRPDRADVAERAREPRARARGFPLPLARARGGRVRKREERRGEGRRGEAAVAAPRQVSRAAFHRECETEAASASPRAASGERLRPGPPVTRGGGLSAAPGLGPCRPLSA